ncbi:hypothetical protein RJ640_027907, partial [Escallonia rubra]
MASHGFQSIEKIDAMEGLIDYDIFDTHVHDEPRVDDIAGKTFDTQEATYKFYTQYALLDGFGTRKYNAHKIRATSAIFRMQFMCKKEGFKKLDDKRLNVKEIRRMDLRTDYEAMMQVTLSKKLGVWVVNKFQDPYEEADITPRQCSSIIRIERKNNVGKECYGIIKHFQEKATSDDNYYFAMDLAINGSLR